MAKDQREWVFIAVAIVVMLGGAYAVVQTRVMIASEPAKSDFARGFRAAFGIYDVPRCL